MSFYTIVGFLIMFIINEYGRPSFHIQKGFYCFEYKEENDFDFPQESVPGPLQ